MKTKITSGRVVRALAILIVPAFVFVELCFSTPVNLVYVLAAAFLCADSVILLHPTPSGNSSLSVPFAAVVFLSATLSPVFGVSVGIPVLLSVGCDFIYLACSYVRKFSDLKLLFKKDAPLLNLEDFSSAAHFSFVLFFALMMAEGAVWSSLFLSAAGFVILFHSALTGRIPGLKPERENSVRNIIKGDLRSSPYSSQDADSRMNALYSRAVEYMEKHQPFLDENFSLAAMSTALYTNKSYLSRVINYYSGRNFKQFVNYYRVRYAVNLIKQDRRLSVLELASMSGFHSAVTFNVAFRLNMNDTPGSYCRNEYA